jgi:hypothetical protein
VSFQIPEISRLAMPRRGGALLDVKLLIFKVLLAALLPVLN